MFRIWVCFVHYGEWFEVSFPTSSLSAAWEEARVLKEVSRLHQCRVACVVLPTSMWLP